MKKTADAGTSKSRKRREKKVRAEGRRSGAYVLELYVSGATPKSLRAIANLKAICDAHLGPDCQVTIIDIYKDPELATAAQIIAVPTLIRRRPHSERRLIGDLSQTARVLKGLGIKGQGRSS